MRKHSMIVRFVQFVVAVSATVGTSSLVAAQDKPTKGVITLDEVQIVGRIQKPVAAVDVNRIQPKLTLQELRQPFLDRIEQVVYSEPF